MKKSLTAFPEEFREQPNHMAQGQTPLGDDSLHLVELNQVCGVQRFVAEHPVNAEHFGWFEILKPNI